VILAPASCAFITPSFIVIVLPSIFTPPSVSVVATGNVYKSGIALFSAYLLKSGLLFKSL